MKPWLVALLLSLILASASAASTITATASGGHPSAPVSDTAGPADSGSILAEAIVPIDSFATMEVRAALDVDGNSAVQSYGYVIPSSEATVVDFPQVTDGQTVWSHTVTNNSSVPVSYRYSFTLSPINLAIFGSGEATDATASVASYDVEVLANGVPVFESHAVLKGEHLSHTLTESGTDFGGMQVSSDAIQYQFSEYQGQVSLGTAGPGESIVVETKLTAHTESYDYFVGGGVTMGDPLDLKGDPGVDSIIIEEDDSVAVEQVSWGAAKHLYR